MRRCLVVGIFKHFFLPLSAHCFGFRAGKFTVWLSLTALIKAAVFGNNMPMS